LSFRIVRDMRMHFSFDDLNGTIINYFGHCKRQAWLFSHGVRMESDSDLVRKGKWVDEHTFPRNSQVDFIYQNIRTDFVLKGKDPIEVHEVKSSGKPKNEHKLQLGFYLLKLEQSGINAVGILNYPEARETVKVLLDDIRSELLETIDNTIEVLNEDCPNRLERSKCRGCGYYELCYSNQEGLK